MTGATFFAILLALYFLPAFVASKRHHQQTLSITLLNIFLGWSVIGWVVALVWAASANAGKPQVVYVRQQAD